MAPPTSLYRYYSLQDEKRLSWVREVVVENLLFLSSPATFNDPYDCRVVFDQSLEATALGEEFAIRYVYAVEASKVLTGEELVSIRNRLASPQPLIDIRALQSEMQGVVDKVGVICFSEKKDDLLMWSHYADGHRGICLEFRHCQEEAPIGASLPVQYEDGRVQLNAFGENDSDQAKHVFLKKATNWEYEKEWRLVMMDHELPSSNRKLKFPPPALRSVILGARICDVHRKDLAEWCALSPSKPVLLQAELTQTQHRLDFRAL